MYRVRHCIYQVPQGGMVGAVGGVAIGAIAGSAALGMTVGRVAGMGAGYIYSNKEASE
jgi:F0F1-type ATP synthase assembly protein I